MTHVLIDQSVPICKCFCGINRSPLSIWFVFGNTILPNLQMLFPKNLPLKEGGGRGTFKCRFPIPHPLTPSPEPSGADRFQFSIEKSPKI
jgi:hypothetical protein